MPVEVFTQRNFVADYSIEVYFYLFKTKKSLFEPPFGGLRGNVCTRFIVRWKARGRLPIRHN